MSGRGLPPVCGGERSAKGRRTGDDVDLIHDPVCEVEHEAIRLAHQMTSAALMQPPKVPQRAGHRSGGCVQHVRPTALHR